MNAQIRLGIKAGGNFSQLYVSGNETGINADQYKGRFSYHFGGMLEYSLSNTFSLQPELMYINHGANLKDNNSFGMESGHVTLNTLQLPVNLKASFNVKNKKLFAYAGPYAAFNMYGRAKGKVNGTNESVELYKDGSDMRRWDYGVGVGVGMEVNKFVFTFSNQFGLADINGQENNKMKAGNLSLSVGYFF